MILQSLTLHNFGIYAGKQTICLSPEEGRPITLIGALNGGGKTTLLEAVQIALYGRTAKCIDRKRGGYQEYLKQAINRSSPFNSASVSVEFIYKTHGNDDRFKVTRTWSLRGSSVDESIAVEKNGTFDEPVTERWGEFIEALIPSQISDLFFFDGEKIESLADPERSAELVRIGVHSLLGLDLVDDLSKSLTVLERRLRAETISEEDRHRLESTAAELQVLESACTVEMQRVGGKQVELDEVAKSIAKLRDQFRAVGGDLFAQRESLLPEREAALRSLAEVHTRLRELAAGAAPLLLVLKGLASAKAQSIKEEQGQIARDVLAYLEDRDNHVLRELKSQQVPQKWFDKIGSLLQETKDAIAQDATSDAFLMVASASLTVADEQLKAVRKSLRDALKHCAEATQRLELIERRIAAVPDESKISELVAKIQKCENLERELQMEIRIRQEERARLLQQHAAKKQQMTSLEASLIEIRYHDRLTVEMKTRLAASKNALTEFRKRMAAKHVGRLAGLVRECFQQLLRKQNFVHDVEIDSDTFTLSIKSVSGSSIPSERLSAGERQLLAISVLWALARASGRRLPTIIDTPLGRLDSVHRTYLVNNYFPYASHQVILLSTDEEIVGNYYDELKPSLAREYLVQYDDGKNASEVSPGYFNRLAEAA